MVTGPRERKLWIQTCLTLPKNWSCVKSCSCREVGYMHILGVQRKEISTQWKGECWYPL